MASARLLQPSFGGGEYDPALWGRQDLSRYGISGRLVRNFIIRPQGGMATRPGTTLVGEVKDSSRIARLIPFQVSEAVGYMVVVNGGVFQFIYRGAFVESGGVRVEVAHEYQDGQVQELRFTQSADALFIAHRSHATQVLKRTAADAFSLSRFTPREGPFRSLNANEALLITASATTGSVVLETNFDLFTENMTGALIKLEPKALGNIKPWVQGERTPNLVAGALRRSDGKIYKATTVPSAGSSPNYTETGNVRPIHEVGREWDGPADTRTFDTINYIVGVEWEYMHSGYGIVEITAFNNARNVVALVKKTLPTEVVGGLGSPGSTWTLSGDGNTKVFPIPGAVSSSESNYTVTVDGVPTQWNDNYQPPGSGGGGGNVGEHGPVYVP